MSHKGNLFCVLDEEENEEHNDTIDKNSYDIMINKYYKNENSNKSFKKDNFKKDNFKKDKNRNISKMFEENTKTLVVENKQKNIISEIQPKFEKIIIHENFNPGMKTNITMNIYAKHINDKEWNDFKSYNVMLKIEKWETVAKFYNTLKNCAQEIKFFNIFIMKNNIIPMWEDSENRNGTKTTVRINDINETINVLRLLNIHFLNKNILLTNNDHLNGLCFTPKKEVINGVENIYFILQIWYKSNLMKTTTYLNNDITNLLSPYIIKKKLIKAEF